MAAKPALSGSGRADRGPELREISHRPRGGRAHRQRACAGAKARCGSATAAIFLWSDIPNNRIMRWDEETGRVSVFRKPSNNANGNTRDRQGRLLTCEHDTRRVTRTEYDGTITVIADRFEGKPLNSPNDIVCKSDGSIWFTDPPFGVLGFYEGHMAKPELPDQRLPRRSQERRAHRGGRRHQPAERPVLFARRIEALHHRGGHPPAPDSRLRRGGRRHEACQQAHADRRRSRHARRLPRATWTATCGAAGAWAQEGLDGVWIFNPEGKHIGRINLPARCANLCFGGVYRNRLFMCGSQSIYSLYVNTQGAPGG